MANKNSRSGKTGGTHDIAAENFAAAVRALHVHPLFAPMLSDGYVLRRSEHNLCPQDGWAVVTSIGNIHVHPTRRAEPEEWIYVLAHCLLHLGFGHFPIRSRPREWNAACDCFVATFLAQLKLGKPPLGTHGPLELPASSEERVYDIFCERGIPPQFQELGTAGPHADMIVEATTGWSYHKPDWQRRFAEGLAQAVSSAVEVAAGRIPTLGSFASDQSPAQQARSWFISSYPLLGALATTFKVFEDSLLCQRMEIAVAAVNVESKEIYFNPAAGLTEAEYRFVMAHELLHVGLRHDARRQGRDPYLWNVACFPAGTWIGDGQPIEHIATMERNYQGDLITIETHAGPISCTPEHPFFARRRLGRGYPVQVSEPVWREAKALGVGDYLLVPRIQQTRADTVIDLRDHIREGTDSLGRRTFANRAVKEIPLDEDTAWFIGLYVAEGNASPDVHLTLSATETDIAAKAVRVLRHMGYSATTRIVEKTLVVNTGSHVLGRWLKQECGGSARTKHIPRVILHHADARIRAAFLVGLVAGDGHSRKQTASSTTACMVASVSERLIADVALLLAQDGVGGARGILRRGPRMIGKTWTNKELILHTFHWNPAGVTQTKRTLNGRAILSHSHRWRADHYGVWYRVKSVSTAPFFGLVYNLSTADHTYIANSFVVHNCDYVINDWLLEMGVGHMPQRGGLHDPDLKGESAEAIYDRMVTDMRRFRKLATLRGVGLSDILEKGKPDWWSVGPGVDLDEFYRRCMSQGLLYHQEQGRGLIPAGLEEEIRALSQPPIPWDVELARWFDHHFPPPEKVHSYARPSRRQSATPDIPRPRWVLAPDWEDGRTFGVLLDTSGSMDRSLLAKALGTIASYSIAREVPAVRVVFCDAATYDQGYMPPEAIAGEVKVRGRGGTVLQPGVDLLERAEDFPKEGPLLIITDGMCDTLYIRREHAFLIPLGHRLPFTPRGDVFYIK